LTYLEQVSDGKALAASGWNLYRFNTDGTPDLMFGTGGVVDLEVAGFPLGPQTSQTREADGWNEIIVSDVDGSIFVVGTPFDIMKTRAMVQKISTSGVVDVTFGTGVIGLIIKQNQVKLMLYVLLLMEV
jgi:hypothetical protein